MAATHRRRSLTKCLRKVKKEILPWIEEKMEKMSKQMTENESECNSEIKKLQKHVDGVIARLLEIKGNIEETLQENMKKRNEKLYDANSELNKKKKEIQCVVKFLEENNDTMSDYEMNEKHRDMEQLLSALDVDVKNSTPLVRYLKREVMISNAALENLIGKSFNLDDIRLTETRDFKYGKSKIFLLSALSEDQCYIRQSKSNYIRKVNKEGEKEKRKIKISPTDMCVTNTGKVYFTDFIDHSISCLYPRGSVATVIRTYPLGPGGICLSGDGKLLVTLIDNESDYESDDESDFYKLGSHSRRLVRHITESGEVIREYEYQEDGQTRLFTNPIKVTQSSNSDISVVNRTSDNTGEVVILSPSGRRKSVYRGQNLEKDFNPSDVVCDSHCNILVPDLNNKQIHMLSPNGEWLKSLLTKSEKNCPTRLSLYQSTLWVGYKEGTVKVFHYTT